jgi:hypothetical protein
MAKVNDDIVSNPQSKASASQNTQITICLPHRRCTFFVVLKRSCSQSRRSALVQKKVKRPHQWPQGLHRHHSSLTTNLSGQLTPKGSVWESAKIKKKKSRH